MRFGGTSQVPPPLADCASQGSDRVPHDARLAQRAADQVATLRALKSQERMAVPPTGNGQGQRLRLTVLTTVIS